MNSRQITIILLVVLAVVSRIIHHPWNLTAVGGVALFAGATLRPSWAAYAVSVGAFFLSDLVLGLHSTMLFTYSAVLICAYLGVQGLAKPSILKVAGLALSSSLIFFVISNFGVWWVGELYPRTWAGLVQCFVMALPFLRNQILGDMLFSALLFGVYMQVLAWLPSKKSEESAQS